MIKTRFAPSPTGLMHLGNVRAALTGRIDGSELADLIALMPRECVRARFAALIKKP
ncbi:MAG: hypothetical protein LC647_05050 [Beggiatoa sp.]|jgi:hypothetical protein|nr:hypothetical protein [Beggiatoa sp.]